MSDINKSIYSHFKVGSPYLVVMRNGNEYNGFLDEKCEDGWIIGKVAVKIIVTLYDSGSNGLEVSMDTEETAKTKFSGKEVYIREPCYARHPWQTIRIWAGDISLLEDSWRRGIKVENGRIDENHLIEIFPEFAMYKMEGGGWCTNPAANGKDKTYSLTKMRMV